MAEEKKNTADTGQEEMNKDTQTCDTEQKAADAAEGTENAGAEKADTENASAETAGAEGNADAGKEDSEDKKGFFGKKKDKEKEALKVQVNELNDKVKRQMAEFDNYRKRTDKEKEQMFSMGERSVLEKILPIMDNFERGFGTVEKEDENDAFVVGMKKIYDQLEKQLTDLGVTPIDAAGKDFDPEFHNAVMQVDSEELETGKVAQELLKGYMFHDSVLRHSMVSVVK